MRVIACICYLHVPKQNRQKLDKKAKKGTLGYDGDDGYRVWRQDERDAVRSRDVIFHEKQFSVPASAAARTKFKCKYFLALIVIEISLKMSYIPCVLLQQRGLYQIAWTNSD